MILIFAIRSQNVSRLSGIPGIDEATALSSAIEHIESDKYDLIVFDTAPTGHTLKLLGMPEILQAGIEKKESWNFVGVSSFTDRDNSIVAAAL